MAVSLSIIQVLNPQEELLSFPLEASLRISATGEPDESDISDRISIVRVADAHDVIHPRLSEYHMRSIGHVHVERYRRITTTVTHRQDGANYLWEIQPNEVLVPDVEYYLMISDKTSPDFYEIVKTVTLGPAQVEFSKSDDSVGDDATYTILITSDSVISTGSNVVGIEMRRNGVLFYNEAAHSITNEPVPLGLGMYVTLDRSTPYLLTEEFTITTTEFTRLPQTYIQKFRTHVVPDIIQPAPGVESQRLQQDQIIKFYEDNAWGRRLDSNDPLSPTYSGGTGVAGTALSSTFKYPGVILIDCQKDIDISTVGAALTITISEAFDNYMLTHMGLYDPLAQYVIKYSVVDLQFLKLEVKREVFLPSTLLLKVEAA